MTAFPGGCTAGARDRAGSGPPGLAFLGGPSLCLNFTSVRVELGYFPGHGQGRFGCPGDSLGSLQLICLKQPQHFLWGIWVSLQGPLGPTPSYSAVDMFKPAQP